MKHEPAPCRRARLAEGDVAVVDACECGVLQVHLGALTVRLTPDGVTSLLVTLEQAVTAYEALQNDEEKRALARAARAPRGQA